jgi:hypothetical protein
MSKWAGSLLPRLLGHATCDQRFAKFGTADREMIHYQVRCSQGHEFDGWFKDSAAFDKQVSLGFLECPTCAH